MVCLLCLDRSHGALARPWGRNRGASSSQSGFLLASVLRPLADRKPLEQKLSFTPHAQPQTHIFDASGTVSLSNFCLIMQSTTTKLSFALLATAAALQAPTSPMRRGVVARAPMVDVLARSSTALCAADDDGYEAPKIEFDPDADVGGRDL